MPYPMSEDELFEAVRQTGPSPQDYRDEDGEIDFDEFDDAYDEWDEESGFSKL